MSQSAPPSRSFHCGSALMRMSGPWLTRLVVNHHIRIAMIGNDHHLTTDFLDGLDHLTYGMIYDLNGLHGCRDHTGMTDHIRVCEVRNDHIVLL